MNKSDIVVGGVYEIKPPDSDIIDKAWVVGKSEEHDSEVKCSIPYTINPRFISSRLYQLVHSGYFIRQVGFDATATDEYRTLFSELLEAQSNLEQTEHVHQLCGEYNIVSSLEYLADRIKKDIKVIEVMLSEIKNKSWMESDDDDRG